MTRRITVLFSAFEAVLVVAIGVAIPLVPMTFVWAAQFGFAPDWLVFWRGAVDIWLIGHGVDVTFTLDPVTEAGLGIPGAGDPVLITIAALGFALLTILLGVRAGTRIAETEHRGLGVLTALAVFGGLAFLVTLSSLDPAARPSLWQGTLFPTLVFVLGILLGVLRAERDAGAKPRSTRVRTWIADADPHARAMVFAALRAGTSAVAITMIVSSVAVTVLIVGRFAELIQLYESLHTELVGGIALTAGELAFVPNLVIWAASWFVGPGFAIGAGSHVSPLGTALGPVPAIPVLGAVPSGDLAFGYLGLLVPIVAGFLAGAAVRPALVRQLDDRRWPWLVGTAVLGGVFGGLLLGLLAAASAGSAGPGRFAEVGPDPLLVGLAAGIEFFVAIGLGLASGAFAPRFGERMARRADEAHDRSTPQRPTALRR
jgi:hypothetical protein